MSLEAYFEANRALWDEWATVHLRGNLTYPVEEFLAGQAGVEPNLPDDIGAVKGKSILHLQCHFGLDTLMWARQGAHVTGVDFSGTAIEGARTLNAKLGMDARFVHSNVYALPNVLEGEYDIVLTYYGVLPWLPDLRRWAEIAAHYLVPGGFLYVADGHPFAGMLEGADPAVAGPYLAYTYFTDGVAERCESHGGTYAAPDAQTAYHVNYQWRHRMGEVIDAVAEAGLHIEYLHEFPYLFCDLYNWPQGGITDRMTQDADGWWRLTTEDRFVPLVFSLRARKERGIPRDRS